jgi:hypothetical protein
MLWALALALTIFLPVQLRAQGALLIVAKGQQFIQVGSAVPALATNGRPYVAFLQLSTETNGIPSVSVRIPNGTVLELESDGRGFQFQQRFDTKTGPNSLDANFGSGIYQFTIVTDTLGTQMPRLTLGPDAYPPTPMVTNLVALQSADSTGPILIAWNKFTGGATNDFVQLEVRDTNDIDVFSTPAPGEPGALNGVSNSIAIPAGVLVPGRTYLGAVLFANVLLSVEDANGKGIAGYFKQTFFSIATAAPPPPQGRLIFAMPVFTESETQPQAAISIHRVGGTSGNVSVTFDTSAGTATAGSDYTETSRSVAFPDGVDSATVNVPLHDDVLLEGPESVRLYLSNPIGGADLGALSNAVLIISDNEITNAGTFQFSAASYKTTERSGKVTLSIMRGGGSTGDVRLDVSTMDGSAVAPGDYAATNTTLVFSNGVRSRMLVIPIANDALDETNESFTVKLSNPTGGSSLGPRSMVEVSIMDDDTAGSLSFSAMTYSVSETSTVANVTIKRSGGKASNVSVDFAAIADTATSPDDFIAKNLNLVLGSNELSKVISIALNPDTLPEAEELFRLTLRNPGGGAKLGAISNAVVRIGDDESSVSFTNASYTVNEAGPALNITVVRSGALATAVSVDVVIMDGSAVSPGDYKGTNFTLSFGTNVKSKTISIPIVNDALDESDEAFVVKLTNPQGGVQLGSITEANVTIVDDDSAGVVQFSAATYHVAEGAGNATIKLVRRGGAASNVTVRLTANTGTATPGQDYTPVNTDFTFASGESVKTILIPVLTDGITEPNETVNLVLSNPTGGATLGPTNPATLTIMDAPDPDAVPLAGPEFFKLIAVGVTNVTFSRTFNASTFIGLISQGFNNSYVIRGDTGGISGVETFGITAPGLTGPGRYSVTAGGPVSALYTRASATGSFGYVTSDPGAVGTIIIDGFDMTRVSGRGEIIMSDDSDSAKWIKVTFGFRAILE